MLDSWARPYLDPRKLGAVMDGVTDDTRAANTCLAYIGTTPAEIMIDTPMKLATPPIWPSNVYLRFVGQGMFVYDNPLTINGTWHAGPQQIFMPTNAAATLSGRPRIPEIYTEWFGAPANGIDDDSVATLLAFNASSMMGYIPVKLLPITYRWAQQILGGGTPAVNFF
jgi:hypothetical protein